jgi:maleylacetate reductase
MESELIEFLPTVRRIRHGAHALAGALREEMAHHQAQRPFVVLAQALRGTAVEALLHEVAPQATLHSASFGHVPPQAVIAAARLARDTHAEVVVALGGGSAIDTAKGLRFALAADLDDPDALLPAMSAASPAGPWLPQISVPTTLSGAEYTRSFSATDRAAGDKRSHTHSMLASSAIVYDPAVTAYTPDALWLGSGLVALDHALEVYVVSAPHPVADALKREAAVTLWQRLGASRPPSAMADRLACQLAAWMADHSPLRTRAVGGTGTPWSHLLAYDLAAQTGVSYAVTAALTLARSLRLLAELPACAARQRALVAALGLDGPLADAVEAFTAGLGLPTTPAQAGLTPTALHAVAAAAARRGQVSAADCLRVLGA